MTDFGTCSRPAPYAIILAAGRGKRMSGESALPKVLQPLAGRPMIAWVIDAVRAAGIDDITIIVGFGAAQVRRSVECGVRSAECRYVLQEEQLGSGHAVACAKEALGGRSGHAIVLCGDSPLFTAATISSLAEHHLRTGAAITLVSATLDDPTGYGRIKRCPSGHITGVVEEKCATSDEKAIREVNGGAYTFDSEWLWSNIDSIEKNDAGEYNLTDLVRVAVLQGRPIESVPAAPEEIMGINTPEDLLRAGRMKNEK